MNTIVYKIVPLLFFIFYTSPANARVVKISLSDNPPLVFTDNNGRPAGILVDLIGQVGQKEGWEIQFVHGSWKECLERLKNGEIDILMSVARSPQREEIYDFTKEPVFSNWGALYRNNRTVLQDLTDIEGKKVGYTKGNIHSKKFLELLEERSISIIPVEYNFYMGLFKDLEEGKVDAAVANRVNGHLYKHQFAVENTNITFNDIFLYFATKKGENEHLRAAIDRSIREWKKNKNSIYYNTLNHWLEPMEGSLFYKPGSLKQKKMLIFAGNKNIPPVESLEEGVPAGLNVDILKALADTLGTSITIKLTDPEEAQQLVLNGQAEALTLVTPTGPLSALYDFTEPVLEFEYNYFVNTENVNIKREADLTNKIVGVTRGGYAKHLLETEKKVKLYFLKNDLEGFNLLQNNIIDAVATTRQVGSYILNTNNIENVIIIPKPFAAAKTSIGVKKGNSELLAELNRGIAELNKKGTLKRLKKRWSSEDILRFKKETFFRLVTILAILVTLLILTAVILWIGTLNKQVKVKTIQLQEAASMLEEKVRIRTLALSKSNDELKKEISGRKKAEDVLNNSLLEKEILLKEIHHRVKNNLAIIKALLNLQSYQINDPLVKNLFLESQNRVGSMALLHEKLYRSDNLSNINIKEYLSSLIEHLFQSYNINPDIISLEMKIADIQLEIDHLIPCGLIINEIITNSLKYAFEKDTKGIIRVEFNQEKEGEVGLTVCDNGKGLNPAMELETSTSLGFQIIKMLVMQLSGTLRLDGSQGTLFEIKFSTKD